MSETVEAPINPNKALWEKGDFTRVAEMMRQSGEEFVDSLGVELGMKVLDLGCGDGITALPAASRKAEVLGVDIAANLVAAGNARAQAAGLDNLSFQEGDASNLAVLENDSSTWWSASSERCSLLVPTMSPEKWCE